MTPRDERNLLQLEPELRSSAIAKPLSQRKLSPALSVVLGLLRAYVIVAIGLAAVAFAHASR